MSNEKMTELLSVIKEGQLEKPELRARLNAVIASELQRADRPADAELVAACQTLLWQLECHGTPYESDKAQSLTHAKEKLQKREKRARLLRGTAMATVAALVLMAGGLLTDALLHREWIEGSSTADEQRYQISGHSSGTGTVQKGQADTPYQPVILDTKSFVEAVDALGFTPPMPAWVPDGWESEGYYVAILSSARFNASYKRQGEENLLQFGIHWYNDPEQATLAFEQSEEGETVQRNGKSLYVTHNLSSNVVVWMEGMTCYSLSGPVSAESLLRMADSISSTLAPAASRAS